MSDDDFIEIGGYLAGLKRALQVEGLPLERITCVVAETRGHLEEMFMDRTPSSETDREKLILEFGPVAPLARQLGAEYARSRPERIVLWPVLAYLLFWAVHMIMLLLGQILIASGRWDPLLATLLVATCAPLFAIGYLAKRTLFGQFESLFAALVAVNVLWITPRVPSILDNSWLWSPIATILALIITNAVWLAGWPKGTRSKRSWRGAKGQFRGGSL